MNIVCVYSVEDYYTKKKPLRVMSEMPFGISMIATVLKNKGHQVELLVVCGATPLAKTLESLIKRFKPKLFCLTAVTTQFPVICKIADIVKKIDPSLFIVVGGAHVSLNPDSAIQEVSIDAICVGEGEHAIIELANHLGMGSFPSKIQNMWIKNTTSLAIEKNSQRPFLENLDDLPFIDRKMWEQWVAHLEYGPTVLVGRGCPFKCEYCSNHALAKLTNGKYVRFRSPENIIGEIRHILEIMPQVDSVAFEVETLGASVSFVLEFCGKLESFNKTLQVPLQFSTNFALTDKLVNDEDKMKVVFTALQKANFNTLNIGLESGSEQLRKDVLRRPNYSNKNIIQFSKMAKEYGININMFVLMGFPHETRDKFKETIKVVRSCQPQTVYLSIFYPYPGTELYNIAIKEYLVKEGNVTKNERRKANLNLPGFSKYQIKREYLLFFWHVYRDYWPLKKILIRSFSEFISQYPKIAPFFRILYYFLINKKVI